MPDWQTDGFTIASSAEHSWRAVKMWSLSLYCASLVSDVQWSRASDWRTMPLSVSYDLFIYMYVISSLHGENDIQCKWIRITDVRVQFPCSRIIFPHNRTAVATRGEEVGGTYKSQDPLFANYGSRNLCKIAKKYWGRGGAGTTQKQIRKKMHILWSITLRKIRTGTTMSHFKAKDFRWALPQTLLTVLPFPSSI